jgi:hypothetical protein
MPELAALREEIAGLRKDAAKARVSHRAMQWLTGVTVILAAGLVWLGFVAVDARDAASAARQNRRAGIVACQASNETRAGSARLWNHVLDILTPPNPTAAQLAALRDLRAAITAAYAPKDCQKLASGVKP